MVDEPEGDRSPLSIQGDSRGVLCLHGLSGTPFEVRPLAEGLGRLGFSVEAPALAGHRAGLAELGATRWPDWLGSAEAALDALLARVGGGPVAVAGFSMGGLLALRLCRLRAAEVAALIVMAAPLRLRPFQVNAIRTLSRLPPGLRFGPLLNVPKLGGCDVSDPEMKRQNPSLPGFPLTALESLIELMAVVRADLPAIRTPALVVHARQDHTVPMEDSLEVTGSLGSEVLERLWLERSYHLVALDVERSALVDAVGRFVSAHLDAGTGHRAER